MAWHCLLFLFILGKYAAARMKALWQHLLSEGFARPLHFFCWQPEYFKTVQPFKYFISDIYVCNLSIWVSLTCFGQWQPSTAHMFCFCQLSCRTPASSRKAMPTAESTYFCKCLVETVKASLRASLTLHLSYFNADFIS